MNRLLLPTLLGIAAILAVVGLSASNVFAQSQTSDAANGTQVQSSDSHENEQGDNTDDHDSSSSQNNADDEESEDDGDEELDD